MAETSTTTEASDAPAPESASHNRRDASAPAPAADGADEGSPPPRRKVYESTLIPERRRRRIPGWVRFLILAALIVAVYFLVAGSRHRAVVNTVGKVVYSAKSGGSSNTRIWIARLDGTGAVPLTPDGQDDDSPVFSPDGNQVALVATSGGVRQVFIMDADGKDLQPVTTSSEAKADPAFAPSSNEIVGFTAAGVLYTASMSANSVDLDRLLPAQENKPPDTQDTSNTQDSEGDAQPDATIQQFAWAPATDVRSQAIAAVEEDNGLQSLSVVPSIDSGDVISTHKNGSQVVPLAAASRLSIAWSPDGALLVAALVGTNVGGKPLSLIAMFDATGNPMQNPPLFELPSASVGPEHPVFSPDGSKIVFELWNESGAATRRSLGLFVVPTSGASKPVGIFGGNAEDARFASDGSLFFLARRQDGGHDLLTMQLDGTGLRRVSDGKEDITAFCISPQHG